MTILAGNERQITAWACRQRLGKNGQDRQRDFGVRLLCLDGADAITDMLAPETDCITAAGDRYRPERRAILVDGCRSVSRDAPACS
jgi:hypothetical protein